MRLKKSFSRERPPTDSSSPGELRSQAGSRPGKLKSLGKYWSDPEKLPSS